MIETRTGVSTETARRMARRRAEQSNTSWASVAFLIEAMLLLVFLTASLALFTQVFGASVQQAKESATLTDAIAIAQNSAERFAADPTSISGETQEGDLRVMCDVTSDPRTSGTLYHATISVYDDTAGTEAVYVIHTARYESGVS